MAGCERTDEADNVIENLGYNQVFYGFPGINMFVCLCSTEQGAMFYVIESRTDKHEQGF